MRDVKAGSMLESEAASALVKALDTLNLYVVTWEGGPAPSEAKSKKILADAYEALPSLTEHSNDFWR